jgi:predicted transposase/invertase (TIGR01784 family)
MPSFTKEAEECENQFERWIYILKNMDTLTRMPWAAQNAVFQRLAEVAEVSKLSKEDRLAYDHALKRYRDTLNSLRGAKEDGRAEGLAEGRAEGILAVARKLKAKGINMADIVDATGLSIEQINRL